MPVRLEKGCDELKNDVMWLKKQTSDMSGPLMTVGGTSKYVCLSSD